MARELTVIQQPSPPEAGSIAPDFELADSAGTYHRLSDLVAQRPIILLFYRGHW